MKFSRSAGVILHPTSLPGPDGIGDLGSEAYRWINFLADSGCSHWQVLPLGPTGYGDSPYQCFSAFAGNPFLVSPTLLLDEHLLTREDLADRPSFPAEKVLFGEVIQWKLTLLDRSYARFKNAAPVDTREEFTAFMTKEAPWLDDFALFMTIKEANGGVSWEHWPEPLRQRDPAALAEFHSAHLDSIQRHKFRQFLFFRQWETLHQYAHQKNITIVGDVPIFVAYDSADAWAHSELFYIDTQGQPTVVAGVPPDYFSITGQRWGNPLYRWSIHRESGYAWWIQRMQSALKLFDIIRLDHFRGFAGYWEIPADKPTAEIGCWVRGPGAHFFTALRQALGDLPIIAEDLGEITQDVKDLRDQFELPGMKILQFAFSNDTDDPFLPHNYPVHCVAYTGTHDNDTSVGWYANTPEVERDFYRRYFARSGEDIAWDLIRGVWSSVACMALTPLQDLLNLGTEYRMNYPGRAEGNWFWRLAPGALTPDLQQRLYEMNLLYSRLSENKKPKKSASAQPKNLVLEDR
jgi:4-alpha-glucanotransferase